MIASITPVSLLYPLGKIFKENPATNGTITAATKESNAVPLTRVIVNRALFNVFTEF